MTTPSGMQTLDESEPPVRFDDATAVMRAVGYDPVSGRDAATPPSFVLDGGGVCGGEPEQPAPPAGVSEQAQPRYIAVAAPVPPRRALERHATFATAGMGYAGAGGVPALPGALPAAYTAVPGSLRTEPVSAVQAHGRDTAGHRVQISSSKLSSWYGQKHVLDEIDLEIREKAITALVGPSGCGKSTYLRCVNRMNDLVRGFRMTGNMTVEDVEVYARDTDLPALRRNVGMVFQHPNPFPMSVYDNIAMAVREHYPRTKKGDLDQVVETSLRQANLWEEIKDQVKDSAFALSGGQQQRLCIARALAVRPDILMLDEPCASLDPVSTARIEELLLELRNDYTIVIVTHNLAQARRISDDMAFFLMGKLIEAGPSAELLNAPQFPETRDYLAGAFG